MQFAPTLTAVPPHSGTGWSVVRAADNGAGWHPHIRALLFHWYNRCANGRLPSRDMVDAVDLGGIRSYMWLLDVERSPWRFRYALAGGRFVKALRRDVTGLWYDEARPLAYAANRTRLITVARDGVPTWRRGPMPIEDDQGRPAQGEQGGGWQDVENLMLPLARDGIAVDAILGIAVPYRHDGYPLI